MCCLGLPMRPRRRSVGALVRTTDLVHIKGNWREAELNTFILLYGPKYSPYWRNLPELCRCCRFCVARKRTETPGRGDPKFRWPAPPQCTAGYTVQLQLGNTECTSAHSRTSYTLYAPSLFRSIGEKKSGREPGDDRRFAVSHSLPVLLPRNHLSTLPTVIRIFLRVWTAVVL